MKNDTYNGWTNRETWAVMLHIDNSFPHVVDDIKDIARQHNLTKATPWFGDKIRDYFNEMEADHFDNLTRDMAMIFSDIGSLWRVDWTEIGKHLADNDEEFFEAEEDEE